MKSYPVLMLFLVPLLISCQGETAYERLGLEEITIGELQSGYSNGAFTIEEVMAAYLQRMGNMDRNGSALNAMLFINPQALEVARQLDMELQSNAARGPLHGIPVVLKDNIDTQDMPTTAGARAMRDSVPPDDAFIAQKLRQAGAVILGKANLSEWANFRSSFSSSGWSGLGGQTHNPFDPSRNPCGSSSGSAAAVSANLTVLAIGTETNGSIVCPASATGVVGIKPTVGLLSRDGLIPVSYTMDTPGPIARTVTDAALALGAMAGIDPVDSRTAESEGRIPEDYTVYLNEAGLQGKRIGHWTGALGDHGKVDLLMQETVSLLASGGAEIIEVESIWEEDINSDFFLVLLYQFKDGLNRYLQSLGDNAPVRDLADLIQQTFSDPVEMQYFDHSLLSSAHATDGLNAEDYRVALERIVRISREEGIDRVMDLHDLDAIVAPSGGPAWKTDLINGDNFRVSSSSPAAIAGYPNISVPMGYIDGLPVGISFFGRAWSEPVLLEIAYAFEQTSRVRRPPEPAD